MFGRKQRWTTVIVFALAALSIPTLATAGEGATAVALVELPDRTVILNGAISRHWIEIRLSGWAPARVREWQASVDSTSFVSNEFGTVSLAGEPCCTDAHCEDQFGPGATCDNGGSGEGLCTPSYQDAERYDWAFDAPAGPIASPYLVFSGSTATTGSVPDDGGERYGGTLVVDITNWDPDVYHEFPIDLLPTPDTFMRDSALNDIPLWVISATPIPAPVGMCCILSPESCADDITQALCTALGGLWLHGGYCTDGCVECLEDLACSDGNVCTTDRCAWELLYRCERTPRYDTRTECCVPWTGQVFGGPDAKLDPCKRIVCNEQNQTYSFEQLPPGAACDDGNTCTQRTFCNAAGACVGQPAYGPTCSKCRYISFRMDELEPSGCNDLRAVRITFVDLPGFEQFNGDTRWLSAPVPHPEIYPGETFNGATLQCDPHFDNFGPADLMHVFGAGVIPGATYEVQTVDTSCTDLEDPACYTDPLTVLTAQWGDIVDPFWTPDGPAQPDFKDISGAVESFMALPGAPIKARAQLQPNVPDPNAAVDFKDIAAVVAAFATGVYPYDGPNSCL